MFLERVDIVRFRGIYRLSLRLDQTTVLIGENNSGKTTILDAIQATLGGLTGRSRGVFGEYDHHLLGKDSRAADSEPIEITLHFVEQSGEEWPDTVAQRLRSVIQTDGGGRKSVTMRVRVKYDDAANESVPEWEFLNLQGEVLGVNASSNRRVLQSLVPLYFLKSIRDPEREFQPNARFWRPFVHSTTMNLSSRQELEQELADLNQRILDAHGSLEAVGEHLGDIAKLIPLASDDPVGIEALPGRVSDILARTQVTLTSAAGAKIPIGRHGEGTQSLAIISLFLAFLRKNPDDDHIEHPTPILTIEEPEAHLHPSAAYSVLDLLQNQIGQNIVATHSGDLVSKAQISTLRRLHRKGGAIEIYQIDKNTFNQKETHRINYHISSARGNLLFARCWLLVEGETERLVFERCARILNTDLMQNAVYCVEYAQSGILQALIRFAKQLGIEWLVVADGDDGGNKAVVSAKKELDHEAEDRHICQLENMLDVLFCLNGYGSIYERGSGAIGPTRSTDPSYWKAVVKKQKSKPATAGLVMEEMERRSDAGVPAWIREIIDMSIKLAEVAQ